MELLYNAAGLIIDTLRTFILIVLSILGTCRLWYLGMGWTFGFAQCVVARATYRSICGCQ